MNPAAGTEVSELVSPHPAVLAFEGQPSGNAAFPLSGQPRGILAFGCIVVHPCQTSEDGSEAGPQAPGVQGRTAQTVP